MKLVSAAVLAACAFLATAASAKQQRTLPDMAFAGPRPADYQAAVKAWLDGSLRDPMSAQVSEVRGPRLASHKVDRGFLGHLWDDPAWWVCYKVNAKNAYGGFTGAKLYMFAFRGGRVSSYAISPDVGYGGREYEVPDVVHECDLSPTSDEGAVAGR